MELGYNELGYNELGYNEHSVIMNKYKYSVGSGHYYDDFSGYNEQNLTKN